jgi:hypothetical protein
MKGVIPHEKGILSDPVPGGVEVTCLKRLKHSVNVSCRALC